MLSPARLTNLLVEFVFLLLGALVVWLAVAGSISVDRHSTPWLAVSVALIVWGLLVKRSAWLGIWQRWNRGGSLILLGLIMLVS